MVKPDSIDKKRARLAAAALVVAGAVGVTVFFLSHGDVPAGAPSAAGAGTAADPRAGARTTPGAPPVVSINGVPSPPPATDDERRAAQTQRMYRARLVQKRLEDLKGSPSESGVGLPADGVDKSVQAIQAKLDELEAAQHQ